MSAQDDRWFRRMDGWRFGLDVAKHLLWAAVAIYGVTVVSGAIQSARDSTGEAVKVQAAPGVTAERARSVVEKWERQVRQGAGGPGLTLDAGAVWESLTPLIRSGEVAPEAATEVVKNVIQGGREITVDAVSQLLERALRSRTSVTASGSGDTIIQTCAPILTVEGAQRIATPRSPTPPAPSACPIEK